MSNPMQGEALERLAVLVAERTGLAFGRSKLADLKSRLETAAGDWGARSAEDLVSSALSTSFNEQNWLRLTQHLTVNETYFWRDHAVFEALIEDILPSIRTSGQLRIWSAGCSTGEEPYSLAIAADRAFPRADGPDVRIFATDINARNLDKARQGIYGPWSFRGVPDWLKNEYFTSREDGRLEIRPDIRARVTFEQANLVSGTLPRDPMDLIFCRNVLMYFTPEQAFAAAGRLGQCLARAGWLVVAASETFQPAVREFTPTAFPGAVLLRKLPPEPDEAKSSRPAPVRRTTVLVRTPRPAQGSNIKPAVREVSGGRSAEALARCTEAVADDRLNAGLHCRQAVILLDMNRNEEAGAALRRALYLDPHHVLAHYMMGSLRFRRGEREAAQRSFSTVRRLLEFWPDDRELPGADGWTAKGLRPLLGYGQLREGPA